MLAWIIVIVLLLLLLIMPVGVHLDYCQQLVLQLKVGPLKLRILPKKPGRPSEAPQPKPEKSKLPKEQKKLRLSKDDIITLLRVALAALHRTRTHLSIDLLKLYWTAAAEDPCDAVMQYGGVNAGLSTLMPYVHEVLKIREEDIRTAVDFDAQKPQIEAQLTATLQVWELLHIANCALAAAFLWYYRKKKLDRPAAECAEQKGTE